MKSLMYTVLTCLFFMVCLTGAMAQNAVKLEKVNHVERVQLKQLKVETPTVNSQKVVKKSTVQKAKVQPAQEAVKLKQKPVLRTAEPKILELKSVRKPY